MTTTCRSRTALLLLATTLSTAAGSAQDADLVLHPGRHAVADLMARCAERLGEDHSARIAERADADPVTLQTALELDAAGARRVLEALSRTDRAPNDERVARRFELGQMNAAQMATALRPFVSVDSVTLKVENGSVVVEGRGGSVEMVGELIAEFDASIDDVRNPVIEDVAAPRADRDYDLTLVAGEYPLADLVDRCARYLGHNILYSRGTLEACRNVKLAKPLHLDQATCDDTMRSWLRERDLVVVDRDRALGLFGAIPLAEARAELFRHARRMLPDTVIETRDTIELVRCTIPLTNVDMPSAVRAVAMFSRQCGFPLSIGTGAHDSLVLCGLKPDVAHAIEAVRGALTR